MLLLLLLLSSGRRWLAADRRSGGIRIAGGPVIGEVVGNLRQPGAGSESETEAQRAQDASNARTQNKDRG